MSINIGPILQVVDRAFVEESINKCNEDPDSPDILLDGDDLIFTIDFAMQRYLFPTKTKLVAKTHELVKEIAARG